MSSWPMDMMPLRDVMRFAAELAARQLGLGMEYDSFAEFGGQYGSQPPYPLAIDHYLASYRMGGSKGMSDVGVNNDTETPVQYVSERLIEAFISGKPGLYIYRSGIKEKIDIEELMGYDTLDIQNSEIPFKKDGHLIVVPVKKWELYKRDSQILSDDELVDFIGGLGTRVTKPQAKTALKPLIQQKSFTHLWELAKKKYPGHVGVQGRPIETEQ